MINPVELSVQLMKCAGAPVGQPLTFTLKAGERYERVGRSFRQGLEVAVRL